MATSPDFIPTDEDPKFLWLAIRLIGREHVERIAAKVLDDAFKAGHTAEPPPGGAT